MWRFPAVSRSRSTASILKPGLFELHSASSLAVFRIVTGLLMFWQLQKLRAYIVEVLPRSRYFATYDLFHWIETLPTPEMGQLFTLLSIASIAAALGRFYRLAIWEP